MATGDKNGLITGATGRQGGSVLRNMQIKGWKLRALTRYTDGAGAQALTSQGIEVVKGDLEDPPSLERAARGVYGVYIVQDFCAVGARLVVQHGKHLADAAKQVGVDH